MIHRFLSQHFIDAPIENVFEFFSRAENLEQITPPWLNFHIVSVEPAPIQKGSLIKYRLRWGPVPLRWTTEITEWQPPFRFQDVQLSGPYRLWRHTHTFEARDGGTLMADVVDYELPLGILGDIAHALVVRRDVERIFGYRTTVMESLFPKAS